MVLHEKKTPRLETSDLKSGVSFKHAEIVDYSSCTVGTGGMGVVGGGRKRGDVGVACSEFLVYNNTMFSRKSYSRSHAQVNDRFKDVGNDFYCWILILMRLPPPTTTTPPHFLGN